MTAHVITEENSIIKTIADRMQLKSCCEYYEIDAVLFKDPEDRVPDAPAGTTWIRRIRVAFEHENYFNSGLFQEVSHLLVTDCDLRVLVSYPNSKDELDQQLDYLCKVISGSDRANQISENSSFLLIVEVGRLPCLEWCGYVFKNGRWQDLPRNSTIVMFPNG